MSESPLLDAEVVLGTATDSAAVVYIRPRLAEAIDLSANATLSGTLRGPRCLYAQTLPAEFRLEDLGREPDLLAKARVPEPCYWSPELPFLYDLDLELRDGDRVLERLSKQTGLRRFAVEGPRWTLDSGPLVLRAWRADGTVDWEQLRQERLALWVDSAEAELVEEASRQGVFLAGPGVIEAQGPAALAIDAERFTLVSPPITAASISRQTPTLAVRCDPSATTPQQARAACERLQRDCAPHTNLAGYVV